MGAESDNNITCNILPWSWMPFATDRRTPTEDDAPKVTHVAQVGGQCLAGDIAYSYLMQLRLTIEHYTGDPTDPWEPFAEASWTQEAFQAHVMTGEFIETLPTPPGTYRAKFEVLANNVLKQTRYAPLCMTADATSASLC